MKKYDDLSFDEMKRALKVQHAVCYKTSDCPFIFLPFLFRCSSSGHLQSSWEEHGPFGSAGMGRWTDCTDINHLLFKDPRYTLRFLWECLTSHKETDV